MRTQQRRRRPLLPGLRSIAPGRDAADLGGARRGLDLRVGGSVCTGEAVVSLGTEHERGEALATGDVLNTAARLQSAADPGALLVGEETYRATRRTIRYAPVDPIVARGKREPVPAWV